MWVEVLCSIYRVWSSTECACCACDPNVHLSVPSICFVCVFVCRKLSPQFKSLRAGSQVFALLVLFLWVILHTMWSGKSMQLLCILRFGMLCENGLCVLRELCTVSFLVVGEIPSVLL